MHVIRTPDDRFDGLSGYPFEPHYVDIADGDGGTMRMHDLDEGPSDSAPVLLVHGEPTWSYLYRHMIPPLVAAGRRVIVPERKLDVLRGHCGDLGRNYGDIRKDRDDGSRPG